MRTEVFEVFSDAVNAVVIRHPGRRFPGIVIQGDSLNNLCALAEAALGNRGRSAEPDELDELLQLLSGYRDHYRTVLEGEGLDLPFSR